MRLSRWLFIFSVALLFGGLTVEAGTLNQKAVPPVGLDIKSADVVAGEEMIAAPLVELRAGRQNVFTHVAARGAMMLAPQTATINVTYNGFSPEAEAAFQYAVDIWETQITSPVVIKVTANWTPLDPGVLGSAGPRTLYRNIPGGQADTWYPEALADALSGSDLSPSTSDIVANFSSTFNWHLGTDGSPPAGQYDFVTVVLHELGHGLGFVGSATVSDGNGSWGYGTDYPAIYDRFVENGTGQALLDTALFPNPSTALADQLLGGDIFFNGTNAVVANSGARPELYAPNPWQSGSSYSHLDEAVFPAGDPNSLMTPQLSMAESIHDVGAIAQGIFQDMGWTINDNSVPTTISISLVPGWNLISVPVEPNNNAIADVLASLNGNYTLVRSYQACDAADPWKTYDPSAPPFANDLTTIDVGVGLWIYMSVADTLVVTGNLPTTTTISLCSGWNLVGYPSVQPQPIADALASITGAYSLVRAYDASDQSDPWKTYDPSAPPFANDLTQMRDGLGYWIRVSEDVEWTVGE